MAAPTRPGNHERGWNDPPMFLHVDPSGQTEGPVQPSPGKNVLNKRVAHPGLFNRGSPKQNPETKEGAEATPVSNVILFPPASISHVPKFTAPIIIPGMTLGEGEQGAGGLSSPPATNPITNTQVNTASATSDLGIPNFDNDEQLYHFVISRLQKVLSDCERLVQPRVTDEVRKKLEILANMWQNGKISYPVKSTMARLATALHKRRCDEAHELHLSLIMDYVSEVSQWMVGVKRLIQEARNVEAPLSPTDTTVGADSFQQAAQPTPAPGEANGGNIENADKEANDTQEAETKETVTSDPIDTEQSIDNDTPSSGENTSKPDTSTSSEPEAPCTLEKADQVEQREEQTENVPSSETVGDTTLKE